MGKGCEHTPFIRGPVALLLRSYLPFHEGHQDFVDEVELPVVESASKIKKTDPFLLFRGEVAVFYLFENLVPGRGCPGCEHDDVFPLKLIHIVFDNVDAAYTYGVQRPAEDDQIVFRQNRRVNAVMGEKVGIEFFGNPLRIVFSCIRI